MQVTVNSANITLFRVTMDFDIYNRRVTFNDISTYAGSSGSGLYNILGISFSLKDQEGVELASFSFTDATKYIVPSSTRQFIVDLSQLSYPFLFQTYSIQCAIKDANGTVYYTDIYYKKICQPQNLGQSGYVDGIFQVIADCVNNVLTVKELSVLTYNNLSPALTTKTGVLYYPTGTISQVAFTGTPFSNNVIYTGQYRITCTTVSEYDLGDDVTVFVTYLTNNVFDITCANKIGDLMCCMVELQNTAVKYCNTAVGRNAQQQLQEITIPFMLGLAKEINGQDASTEAALIKKTLNCDCGATSMRQNEMTPLNPSTTNIVLVGVGGTTIPSPSVNGNTKTYNVTTSIFQVSKGNTGDLAFSIQADTSTTNLVKYKITFNYNTMASYILSAIAGDANLVQQLNSLISFTGGGGNVDLSGLDGKCVIDLTSINYFLTQNVNASTKVTVLSTATVDYAAPANLFASSAGTVQAWLNGLGLGTFVVNYSGGVFSVLSLNNANQISAMTFSNPDLTVVFQSTNATLVSVLQAIIDYLCTLTSLQITLGNTITMWQIDYNGNAQSASYTAGTSQAALNQAIATSIYNLVQTIISLTGVTCTKIQSIFQDYVNTSFGTSDRIYGTLGGNCASLTDKQIATLVIAAINKYSDVKTDFCAIDCEAAGSCPEVAGNNTAMAGSSIGIYGVAWATTPNANQQVTVRYKQQSVTTWTVATGNLNIFPNGSINGSSPFLISGVTQGVIYDIWISNNCGGEGFVSQITIPTSGAYSGSFLKGNILYLLCGGSPNTYYTSGPFGVGQIVYTNVGLTVPLTGYVYIADNVTGEIYTINSTTGLVTADTGSSCSLGVANSVNVANSTVAACASSGAPLTYYTNGAFAIGGILYTDSSLTTPVTGYAYVVLYANNHIYNLNTITGVIGSDTGLTCSAYSSATFRRSNSTGTICAAATETLYSSAPFDVGVTMYTDAGLTTLATGYQYIENGDNGELRIYNMNSGTGVVGSDTGFTCLF